MSSSQNPHILYKEAGLPSRMKEMKKKSKKRTAICTDKSLIISTISTIVATIALFYSIATHNYTVTGKIEVKCEPIGYTRNFF